MPKVECLEAQDRYGRFVAEPLEKGFATTLGNALRRVLLNYLPGAAVARVNIEGIQHEFSSIPSVKEDTTEFLLNLKALRLKPLIGQPGTLRLEVSGQREVHASDITPSADFEIVNPELYLCTLDSSDARLYAELDIDIGRGYRIAESGDNLAVGSIPLDSIFTPMRKVNFTTEPIHVGQETSLERLILELWSDGTLAPADAVSLAAEILMKQFQSFTSYAAAPVSVEAQAETAVSSLSDEKYNMPVEQLDLSVRTMNCLRHAGITTVGELVSRGTKELMGLRNFGQKSAQELKERLATIGVSLVDDDDEEEEEEVEEVTETKKTKKVAAEKEE